MSLRDDSDGLSADDLAYAKGYAKGLEDGQQQAEYLEARASATAAIQLLMSIPEVRVVKHVGDGTAPTAVKIALERARAVGWDAGHASGYQRALGAVNSMLTARGLYAEGFRATTAEELGPALDTLCVRWFYARWCAVLAGVLTVANILWWVLR